MGTPPGNTGPYEHGDPSANYGGSYRPRYYSGQPAEPAPSGPSRKPPRRPRVALAAASIVGLVVGAGVATPIALNAHGHAVAGADEPSTNASASPSTGSSAGCTQTVHATDMGADYSVPCGWVINKPDTAIGFTGSATATTTLASVVDSTEDKPTQCTADLGKAGLGSSFAYRGLTGVSFAKGQTDPRQVAEHAVTTWAGSYDADDGSRPAVHVVQSEATTVTGDTGQAWMTSALLIPKQPNAKPRKGVTCPPLPAAALEIVVAVHATKPPNNPDNCAILVITADEPSPGAMPAATLDAIANSLTEHN